MINIATPLPPEVFAAQLLCSAAAHVHKNLYWTDPHISAVTCTTLYKLAYRVLADENLPRQLCDLCCGHRPYDLYPFGLPEYAHEPAGDSK